MYKTSDLDIEIFFVFKTTN